MACLQSFSKPTSSVNALKKSSSFASASSADAVIAASAVEKTAVSYSLLVDPVESSSTHLCPLLASLPEVDSTSSLTICKHFVTLPLTINRLHSLPHQENLQSLKNMLVCLRSLLLWKNSKLLLNTSRELLLSSSQMKTSEINSEKSEIFFGGFSDIECAIINDISGFKRGTFPTCYLDLPLSPKKISFATLQPFLEKITSKLNAWAVKSLSFTGKITLVSSVIYDMVNFWSSVFNLPKRFYVRQG